MSCFVENIRYCHNTHLTWGRKVSACLMDGCNAKQLELIADGKSHGSVDIEGTFIDGRRELAPIMANVVKNIKYCNNTYLTWGRKTSVYQAKLDGWLEREAVRLRAGEPVQRWATTMDGGSVDIEGAFTDRRRK